MPDSFVLPSNAADQRPLTVWEMRDAEGCPRSVAELRGPVRWNGWLGFSMSLQ